MNRKEGVRSDDARLLNKPSPGKCNKLYKRVGADGRTYHAHPVNSQARG